MISTNLRLPDEVHEALRERGFRLRVSVNSLIVRACRESLAAGDPAPGPHGGCQSCGRPAAYCTVSLPPRLLCPPCAAALAASGQEVMRPGQESRPVTR